AHEAVEMHAALAGDRQLLVAEVDQEGLAATDAAPKVQAARRGGATSEQAIQPACGVSRRQLVMDAIQRGQRLLLCRVGLPAAAGDAFGVGEAGSVVGGRCCWHDSKVRLFDAGSQGFRSPLATEFISL